MAQATVTDSIYFLQTERPGYGSIGYIFIYNAGSIMEYVSFDHLGHGGNPLAITISGDCTIKNSTVKNSGEIGIYLSSVGNPVIQNNKFINNPGNDIWIHASSCGNIHDNSNAKITLVGGGLLTADATLPFPGEESYYYLEDRIEVGEGQILTIEPGVVVKFSRYSSFLNIEGRLLAKGTAADSIRFQGMGDRDSPQTGQINMIGPGSVIEYVSIDHLGYVDHYPAIYMVKDCSVRNSTIKNSAEVGIVALLSNANVTIQNNKFANNPIDISANPSHCGGIRGNANAKIYIGQGTIASDAIWPVQGAGSYYFLNRAVSVSSGQTLTIEPGVIVEFPEAADVLYIDGRLLARGTSTDSIYFRGKGSVNSSQSGRITIRRSGSVMEYVSVDSLGNNVNPAISLAGICTIKNSTFKNSPYFGIYVSGGSGQHLFSNCSIYANAQYGVYVDSFSSVTVDTRNCYWGSPTGPYHPTLNPSGTGNRVSNNVLFNPWITALSCLPTTIKAGNWNDPTVWLCGQIPGSNDPVLLRHVVIIPIGYTARAKRVAYETGGSLSMGADSKMQFGN